MALNAGQAVIILSDGLALSASGNIATGSDSVVYSEGLGRGPSEKPSAGKQVMLVSGSVAQGAAAGGPVGEWHTYNEAADGGSVNGSVTVGSNPELDLNHDGSRTDPDTSGFLKAWNTLELTGDWDVTFFGVDGTRSGPENNLSIGVTAAPEDNYRWFDSSVGPAAYAWNSEGASNTNTFAKTVDNNDTFKSSDGILGDLKFEKRGDTITYYRNGNQQSSHTVPSDTYHPAVMLEDDKYSTKSEAVTISSVEVTVDV